MLALCVDTVFIALSLLLIFVVEVYQSSVETAAEKL